MLSVKQESCEYQIQSHWFDPTRNQTQVYNSRGVCSHHSAICMCTRRKDLLSTSSFGCDVALRSNIILNGWASIRQPPCQALVHNEQTPNPIWMAVYGTRRYNMVCGLFLFTTLTGCRGSHAPFMH